MPENDPERESVLARMAAWKADGDKQVLQGGMPGESTAWNMDGEEAEDPAPDAPEA